MQLSPGSAPGSFIRVFADTATATAAVLDAPTSQLIGVYWLDEVPDIGRLGPVTTFRLRG